MLNVNKKKIIKKRKKEKKSVGWIKTCTKYPFVRPGQKTKKKVRYITVT